MLKLIFAVVAVAIMAPVEAKSKSKATCEVTNGKKLISFGDTMEYIKFPCKYNAIRETQCGGWKVTISPGNMLENNRNKLYVIRTVWVGVERVRDGRKWEGRTSLKIAKKYLEGFSDAPFNTKDGTLDITEVFNFGPQTADQEVSLIAKSGDFKISFSLYEPYGRWHRNSKIRFECYSKEFVPTPYPTQLCGNGTKMEVKSFKKSKEWKENRQATLFFNIFSSKEIIQTDTDCIAAQRAVSKRCIQKGEDLRYKAASLCWPLVGKPDHQRCISSNMDSPISAFRHCVEFVCSGYKDVNACISLGEELDLCPSLPEISETIKATCKSDLYST